MLDQVKMLLGITDGDLDELLEQIIEMTTQRLLILLGGAEEVPEKLSYIVTDTAVRRYNRIGSEGLSSHTVEGETMSWPDDDFAPFEDDIQAYLDTLDDPGTTKGRVRFL